MGGEEVGWAGDQDDAEEGNEAADLLDAGEGFGDELGAEVGGKGRGEEGEDGGIGEREVLEGPLIV